MRSAIRKSSPCWKTFICRRSLGCVLAGYFLGLPPLLGNTLLRHFRRRMGLVRFTLLAVLLLVMLALPLKMLFSGRFNNIVPALHGGKATGRGCTEYSTYRDEIFSPTRTATRIRPERYVYETGFIDTGEVRTVFAGATR